MHSQLSEYRLDVDFHSIRRDPKLSRDDLVGTALEKQLNDLVLPRCQSGKRIPFV
jgi:hypothetical protein